MRATIYARISSDREGAGLGVADQEADCRALADRLGATVVAVHTDNDLSAYSGKPRPGYRALLGQIEAGETDLVLAWHTDRLHRSPTELEQYISTCEPRRVATHTVKAGPLDLATPSGRMVARTLGNHARYETEHAVERMQRAKLRSAEAGIWKGGRRPFGYEADGITVREEEAVLVVSAGDAVLAGMSVAGIARDWNAAGARTAGGKPWDGKGVRRVLLRPRNAGLMEHQGEIVGKAQWPSLLDVEKWRAIERVLRDPSRRTNNGPSTIRHLGSGLYLCGVCGARLRASSRRDGVGVYRCEGGHVCRTRVDLDGYVEAVVVERLREPDLADLLATARPGVDVVALEAHAVELRERLNQLSGMFATGAIDAEQLTTGTRTLNDELATVREKVAGAYRQTAFDGVLDARDPGAAWLQAPLERRRAVLDALTTVTVDKSATGRPRGWKPGESYFRPETVRIEWKS